MPEKFKNNIYYTAAHIERYYNGQMSERERHALEKAALDDPFLADALEGYAHALEAQKGFQQLKVKLSERIKGSISQRKKVLIIDDEVDLCLLMKAYFKRKNYEVYIAHTLKDGVHRLNEIVPDYLFIDYSLPDGSGWDELLEIYKQHPGIQYHLISGFRPSMPSGLGDIKLTVWEKPVSLKALDHFFFKNSSL